MLEVSQDRLNLKYSPMYLLDQHWKWYENDTTKYNVCRRKVYLIYANRLYIIWVLLDVFNREDWVVVCCHLTYLSLVQFQRTSYLSVKKKKTLSGRTPYTKIRS